MSPKRLTVGLATWAEAGLSVVKPIIDLLGGLAALAAANEADSDFTFSRVGLVLGAVGSFPVSRFSTPNSWR